MPPRKAKQTTSVEIPSFPPPPTTAPTAGASEDARQTPEPSPAPSTRATHITYTQKQALIDDLQLEITDRARKLRAQYALQAQGLRARLELRVNRIPHALRKRNIQDLLDEHAAKLEPKPAAPVPVVEARADERQQLQRQSPARKSLKRTSEHLGTADDKENVPANYDLPNPKKRTKTVNGTANTKATRAVSLKGAPASVLSPRSNNSRTFPQSPLKAMSPEKPPLFTAKTASPMKPLTSRPTAMSSKRSSRAPSRQTKRPGTARSAIPSSDDPKSPASIASAGTTIITKPGTKRAATARKAPVPKASAAAPRRGTAGKKDGVAPAATTTVAAGGRTLRKRG